MQASDNAFNGTTVQNVDGRGNRATCVQTKGGINPNLEEGESDYDDEGPSPCMVCADFADHGADRQAIAFAGGATCENAVGKRIVRTTMEAFRNGAPAVGARPRPGDILCAVWHLEGGGYIHPAPLPDDPSLPDTIVYSWYDDHGGEFDPVRMPRAGAAPRRPRPQAPPAPPPGQGPRCGCGNFATPGYSNCNACRAGPRRPPAAAPSPKRRKPAPGEEVCDLTGDD